MMRRFASSLLASRPENIRDDDAAWNRIDTKIKMDEILSVELQPNGAFEPDRKKKKKEEE